MSKIRVMNENLANKIAAGEVVEKISSVVKELVENSLDAHAKHVVVSLMDGGLKSISVLDDGDGMDKEDALLAFSRHATSKLYRDDDLFFIDSSIVSYSEGVVYATSKQIIKDFIEEIGEDNFKKYILEIEG